MDEQTDKQTNEHTNLCIELRYAQLTSRYRFMLMAAVAEDPSIVKVGPAATLIYSIN